MTLMTAFMTFVNIVVAGITIFSLIAIRDTDPDARFDNGVARLVVRERLDSMPQISASQVRLNKGCVERSNNSGTVIGSGDALTSVGTIEGVPVIDSSAFTYRANVSSRCTAKNLNCYDVTDIDINGSRKVAPRL
jgi:hypothetical protein